jgi:1-acyl-sn-glycerol-3-phosphate acyltransferase
MQEASGWPVVPVATNLGLRWQQEDFRKYPGPAVIEFLDPIPPGLGKDEFLKRLSGAIIENTDRLVAEGREWDKAHNLEREPDRLSKKTDQDTEEDRLAREKTGG